MKLIDYVTENDPDIDRIKTHAEFHGIELPDYIRIGYCPSLFKTLVNTPYEKPFAPTKKDKLLCKYLSGINDDKCKECWNREILVRV